MNETFRVWLAKELEKQGWSQRKFAEKSGISQPMISQTLSGDVPVSADFCIKVATALEVAPEWVLRLAGILPAGDPAEPTDDSHLQELTELARSLPPEQRKEALDYVRYLFQKGHRED